jgi:CheY-like chemotaxis protein
MSSLVDGALANVLLVDDSEPDIVFTRLVLEVAGLKFNLTVATGAHEALNMLQQRAGTDAEVDLLLLDINMPGMDGFELLRFIRATESLRDIAVVMCSGSDYHRDRARAEALGAAAYVLKPLTFDHLKVALERIPTLRIRREGEACLLLQASDQG